MEIRTPHTPPHLQVGALKYTESYGNEKWMRTSIRASSSFKIDGIVWKFLHRAVEDLQVFKL